jgi:putative acetyltransferase
MAFNRRAADRLRVMGGSFMGSEIRSCLYMRAMTRFGKGQGRTRRKDREGADVDIRGERSEDATAIGLLTDAAFRGAPYSAGTEAAIVAALRSSRAFTLSLVASEDDEILGHAAFSPVRIDGVDRGWHGLGPVSVRPDRQRGGIGRSLILEGLDRLRSMNAAGCVVLGDPAYYGRFGFESDPALRYSDAPIPYFQRLVFTGPAPTGEVTYPPSFRGEF